MTRMILRRTKVRDQHGETTHVLIAREDTGLIIGAVAGSQLMWGTDPQRPAMTMYLDHDRAVIAAKTLCREELERDDVDFIVEDMDQKVQLAVNMPSRVKM